MLDIAFVRENYEVVKKAVEAKGFVVDVDKLLELDKERRDLLGQAEHVRSERNRLAKQTTNKPSTDDIETGKKLKTDLSELESKFEKVTKEFNNLLESLPNVIPEDTPMGGEESNREERKWGESKSGEGTMDHLEWGEKNGLIDFERGAKVAGHKFYYLKGPLVELEMALVRIVMDKLLATGFMPMLVPHLVNQRSIKGTGFMARGEEGQIYNIEGEDLHLIATAEIPLAAYHADEILDIESLPILYAGISPSYRLEAGAYGKHSKGLYRVHQFDKLEMYVYCLPKDSEEWQNKLVGIEEEICQLLEIPYRVVRIASRELGAPAYKKYDIEYWSPVSSSYRELMSCSNVTDYQSRRLGIRYRDTTGNHFLHTLNATAMASSRTIVALIENHQIDNDKISLPFALAEQLGRSEL